MMTALYIRSFVLLLVATFYSHHCFACEGNCAPQLTHESLTSIGNACGTDPLSAPDKLKLAEAVTKWKTSSRGRSLMNTNNVATPNTTTIEIPVYFHILQYDESIGRMNRTTVTKGFMATLNQAYSVNTPFRFSLKKITRTIDPEYYNCSKGYVEFMFKSELRMGGTNALNVYVCNAYDGQGVAGWGTYPIFVKQFGIMDGVVVQNPDVYGTYVSEYYTLVHETGHVLGGLLHTFEDGCATAADATYYDDDDNLNTYANLVNDGVADTPSHALPTDEYPGQATCWQNASLNTCDDSIPGIDVGPDPVDNYMNYIGASCRQKHGRFTPGQVERIVAEYYTYRHPVQQCRFRNEPCRKNSRCCIGLTCLRKRSATGGVLERIGSCGKCRWPGAKCFRNSDCCDGLYCQAATSKCKEFVGSDE